MSFSDASLLAAFFTIGAQEADATEQSAGYSYVAYVTRLNSPDLEWGDDAADSLTLPSPAALIISNCLSDSSSDCSAHFASDAETGEAQIPEEAFSNSDSDTKPDQKTFDDKCRTRLEIWELVDSFGLDKLGAWSKAENEALVYEMIWALCNATNGWKSMVDLWNWLSMRLRKWHGVRRPWSAIRMQWFRYLRKQTGVDERRKAKPDCLATSLLVRQKAGLGASAKGVTKKGLKQTARKEEEKEMAVEATQKVKRKWGKEEGEPEPAPAAKRKRVEMEEKEKVVVTKVVEVEAAPVVERKRWAAEQRAPQEARKTMASSSVDGTAAARKLECTME
ncbi:hypothetical protein K432DRAFT_425410 [Lepidopterella palustris CBS 459.81]|uniref:Myb-like domain-containing protein n=1 Tax=Lepidopterella palustris CBS 459.81 TaxID=1314670 RepID=A0A8E2JFN7_9PEZI|nr:hypothetical protein K432DRAFT_425410 [Lepidopterella palustris CBS 459.81]